MYDTKETIERWARFTTNVIVAECGSMAHVLDRAAAFRFVARPWTCVGVRPDGIVLTRQNMHGRPDYIYVVVGGSLVSTWMH